MGFKIGRILILGTVDLLVIIALSRLEFIQTAISNMGSTTGAFIVTAWIISLLAIVMIDAVLSGG